MTNFDIGAIARSLPERVYNTGDIAYVDEIVSPDFVRHGLGGTVHGTNVIKDRVNAIRTGFPDFHITVEDLLTDGDKVVLRQTHTGTHTGKFMGVPPTGNQIQTTEISILRVADGKIHEVWVNVDLLTMLQQIGAVELPGR